jgi:hypothetical protein
VDVSNAANGKILVVSFCILQYMDSEISRLTAIAYGIFPKGISDNSVDYQKTTEYHNLMKLLEKRNRFSTVLSKLGNELSELIPEYRFEDLSAVLKHDRCVRGRFLRESPVRTSFLIYVSVIIPNYVLIQSSHQFPAQSLATMNCSRTYMQPVSEENKLFFEEITTRLKNCFPGYGLFDTNLLDIEVQDIVFDGNGSLSNFLYSRFTRPMTFFNIFFSNNYLIA